MNPLIAFFNTILYQPLFNALLLLYLYLPGRDFGIAVIVLTLLIRFLIYPLTAKAMRNQKALAELQPKVKEIQERYKEDKTKQAQAMLGLYKEAKINPLAGFLPLLIQIPLLIALFLVLRRSIVPDSMTYLYNFVPKPDQINFSFLGLIDLSKSSPILTVLAGITQFFQSKIALKQQTPLTQQGSQKKTPDFSSVLQKQMLYFFPVLTVLILWRLPSAIGLYWLVSSLFAIGEQYLILNAKIKKQNEK